MSKTVFARDMTIQRFRAAFGLLCIGFIVLTACGGPEHKLDEFSTYEYYESSLPGIGASNLLIRKSGSLQLFRAIDTLEGELSLLEMDSLAMLLHATGAWDSTFRSENRHEQRLTRFHPEGVSTIRYFHGADAPEDVQRMMKLLKNICERLRRERSEDPV